MIFLCCVLAAILIGILFRYFPKWDVNPFHAIVINYTTCLAFGWLISEMTLTELAEVWKKPWFTFDIILGVLFISGFNIMALSIRHFGISMSVLMQRMSLVSTVAITVLVFGETFRWLDILAILAAVGSIYLINKPNTHNRSSHSFMQKSGLFVLLIISSAIEILLYYVQKEKISDTDHLPFTMAGFGVAAVAGWIILLVRLLSRKSRLLWKDVFAGLILGVPNFFSIYLVLVLLHNGWTGSILYPILNVSILLGSVLFAVILFREKLSPANKAGIALAVIAISILAIAQNLLK